MRPWRQNGSKWGAGCPKIGGSCFQKKCFCVFRGCDNAKIAWNDVPKSGFLISGKKIFTFLGHAIKCGMSIFRHFLFSENNTWQRFFKSLVIHHRFHHRRFHPNQTLSMTHHMHRLCFATVQSHVLLQMQTLCKERISWSFVHCVRQTTE